MNNSTLYNSNHVLTDNNNINHIKSAIDILLASDCSQVKESSIGLTKCSPDLNVIISKQGGICVKCNRMFKSKVSLDNHINNCK